MVPESTAVLVRTSKVGFLHPETLGAPRPARCVKDPCRGCAPPLGKVPTDLRGQVWPDPPGGAPRAIGATLAVSGVATRVTKREGA